jgi:small subunit ribosomal protein S25e
MWRASGIVHCAQRKNAQAAKGKSTKGAKAKKKSWTKTKVKEKLNNAVFLDEKQYERMIKEVPKILCITRAVLCEKFKVAGSVARALIKDMASRGFIIPVGDQHHSFDLYKGKEAKTAAEKAAAEAAEPEKGKKGKK